MCNMVADLANDARTLCGIHFVGIVIASSQHVAPEMLRANIHRHQAAHAMSCVRMRVHTAWGSGLERDTI